MRAEARTTNLLAGVERRRPDAASPGCWAIYGEILAREFEEYRYPPIHRLTVDAYLAQHPGRRTRQTTRSVNIHLISLCLVLEKTYPAARVTYMMGQASKRFKPQFTWLEPPASRGEITVLDVAPAVDLADHERRVRE